MNALAPLADPQLNEEQTPEAFEPRRAVLSVNGLTGAVTLTPGTIGAEPALGNPVSDGQVLASTVTGARSWVTSGSAGSRDWSTITNTPTTIAGYGITDAQPLDSDLTSIAGLSTTSFGRGFLPLADGPSARTYIGAGTSSFSGLFTGLDFTSSNLTSLATRNFSDLTLPSVSAHTFLGSAAGGVASFVQPAFFDLSGTAGGDVTVRKASGVVQFYRASANTDIARGAALVSAVAALASGDRIDLDGGSIYEVAAFMELVPNVTWDGHGATVRLTPMGTGSWGISGGHTGTIIWGVSASRTDNVHIKHTLFDCNMQNQTATDAEVGAVLIYGGSNSSIEDCRAINWGTKSATECFVLAISCYNDGGGSHNANKILRCTVDTPAPILHSTGGATAIAITDVGAYPADASSQYGAEITGCSVHDVTIGNASGQPYNFNAYSLGGSGSIFHDNAAWNLLVGTGSGGVCAGWYHDTGSVSQQLISGNYFNNVAYGVYDQSPATNHIQDITVAGNFIRAYFDCVRFMHPSSGSNAFNLTVKGNTFQQAQSGGIGLNLGQIHNVTYVNNTVDCDYVLQKLLTATGINAYGNLRSDGAPITQRDDGVNLWLQPEPWVDEKVSFTPSTVGWYRIATSAPGAEALIGGRIALGYHSTDNYVGEVEFSYSVGGYNSGSSITQLRGYQRAGAFPVDQVRVSDDSSSNSYVDIHVSHTLATPVEIYSYGQQSRARLVAAPSVGATVGTGSANTLTFQTGGISTTGWMNGVLPGVATNQFVYGTGDDATYSTYNLALSLWHGLAFYNPTGGGAYPNQPSGLLDVRNGILDMLGGFKVNGVPLITSAGAPVQSVAGKTGIVTLATGDISGLGTIATLADPLTEIHGGTNQTTYALGDILYASAANTLSKLAGNSSAALKVLSQTGTGTASAVPSWTSTTGSGNVVRDTGSVITSLTGRSGQDFSITPGGGGTLTLTATNATVSGGSLTLSGNQSAPAWLTSGLRLKGVAGTLTDTSSTGTVAAAFTDRLGGNTIAASNATTFTEYASLKLAAPVAGTNVTITNGYALDADSALIGTLTLGTALPVTQGGNGLTTAALGDLRYGSGANTLSTLSGNITTTKKFLSQTGTGTVSAIPVWGTLAQADITGLTTSDSPTFTGATFSGGTITGGASGLSLAPGGTGQNIALNIGTNKIVTDGYGITGKKGLQYDANTGLLTLSRSVGGTVIFTADSEANVVTIGSINVGTVNLGQVDTRLIRVSAGVAGAIGSTSTNAFGQLQVGTIALQGLATPAAPTLGTSGAAGATSYTYKIVAKQADGTPTEASPSATIATGNAALSSTNKITFTITAVTGATSYDIYRTASGGTPSSTGKIGNTTSLTTFTDTGLAGDSATAPTANKTGRITGNHALTVYIVSTLPAAPSQGDTASVSDATAPTYLGTLTGGGAVFTPVVYNGTEWVSY